MRTRNPGYDRAAATTKGRTAARRAGAGPLLWRRPDGTEYLAWSVRASSVIELDDDEVQIGGESTRGYTNDSGATLGIGDVVVIVGTTAVTTTTAQDTRPVGVVIGGGADGETVTVQTAGYVALVNVTAAVTADFYAETSTTAAKATESVTRRIGSFGIYLTGGTTPSLLLFGMPDSAGTGVGGAETPVEHGNMGATETIDLGVGSVHRGTLNANCAITITGFTAGEFADPLVFEVAQNGTGGFAITWDADVEWYGENEPAQAATAVTHYGFFGMDGDGTIYGFKVGGLDETSVRDIGHWEVVVSGSAPPVAVTNEAADDWIYGWVPG